MTPSNIAPSPPSLVSNFDMRATLLALALIPPALATVPPVPARCIFGPAGADYPQGTMALTCRPVPPQAKEAQP
jgi:hypothetical protein